MTYKQIQEIERRKIQDARIKFGVAVMIWENSEFLFTILREIRHICDYILLGWQDVSYSGKELEPRLFNDMSGAITKLRHLGLVDDIISVDNMNIGSTYDKEITKRNALYDTLVKHGCNYCLVIDSDEFHLSAALTEDLLIMNECTATSSYIKCRGFLRNTHIQVDDCVYTNYIKRHTPDDKTNYVFAWNPNMTFPIDYTRVYTDENYMKFDKSCMYHFNWIRKSFNDKLDNYAQPAQLQFLTEQSLDILFGDYTDDEILSKGVFNNGHFDLKLYPYNNHILDAHLNILAKLQKASYDII